MTIYIPSSLPPSLSHDTPLSAKRQHDSVTLTARKVDLELLRLKGMEKVTKKMDTDDRKKPILTTNALQPHTIADNEKHIDEMSGPDTKNVSTQQQQQQLEEYQYQLETSQQQVHTLKEELKTQYQQHEQQLQQEMTKHQTQLVQQEKLAHDTIADYMEKIESSQVDVRKLTLLVEKQDRLIELLMDERQHFNNYDQHKQKIQEPRENDMTADWHSLYLEKRQLDTAIGSLKANMETNQAHMQMIMMVSTEIQNDFERQKTIMEQQLSEMANELSAKNTLLQHYQEQQITNTQTSTPTLPLPQLMSQPQPSQKIKSSTSYRPIVNDGVIPNSDITPFPSLVSSFSSSRSSSSTISSSRPSLSFSASSPPPHLHLSTSSSITSAPSSPPPTIPLPPIPHQSTTSSKQQHSHQYPHYSNKQFQSDSSPMESLDAISFGGPVKKCTAISQQQPRTGSLDESTHSNKPFWKSMKTKWRNS